MTFFYFVSFEAKRNHIYSSVFFYTLFGIHWEWTSHHYFVIPNRKKKYFIESWHWAFFASTMLKARMLIFCYWIENALIIILGWVQLHAFYRICMFFISLIATSILWFERNMIWIGLCAFKEYPYHFNGAQLSLCIDR